MIYIELYTLRWLKLMMTEELSQQVSRNQIIVLLLRISRMRAILFWIDFDEGFVIVIILR